jgi:uncharacterized membrane protein YphA (DoxX/SURF4 family)
MAKNVIYWVATGLVALSGIMAALAYLAGGQQAVEGFTRVGYPQQLRILLGIAKPLGAIVLLIPGWPRLKEWAYAGFTFAWIAAVVAHYLAGQHGAAIEPLVLLIVLFVSYFTRPESRRLPSRGEAHYERAS